MKDVINFKWKFYLMRLFAVGKKYDRTNKFLFVTHSGTQDWILGAKARRLSRYFDGESEVFTSDDFKQLPQAEGYFFLHQKYYAKALRFNPFLKKARSIVMFTHPEWNAHYCESHARYTLQHAHKIICLNQGMKKALIQLGLPEDRIEVYHLASNPDVFTPKLKREGNTVGICCYYSQRKNPELIYHLVTNMPDMNFVLVGRNWENYEKFDVLMNAPNFTYHGDVEYEQYPELYQQMDVFLSPSFLEGGPVPVLEAMLTNLVPVASHTGYCPDLIQHGENGYLFHPEQDDHETVARYIRKAAVLDGNIRKGAREHSWQNYGNKIYRLFVA
jgi:glycosyltransferase involved in cell wall biosynthesis